MKKIFEVQSEPREDLAGVNFYLRQLRRRVLTFSTAALFVIPRKGVSPPVYISHVKIPINTKIYHRVMTVQFVKTKGSNVKGNQAEKTTRTNRKAT